MRITKKELRKLIREELMNESRNVDRDLDEIEDDLDTIGYNMGMAEEKYQDEGLDSRDWKNLEQSYNDALNAMVTFFEKYNSFVN